MRCHHCQLVDCLRLLEVIGKWWSLRDGHYKQSNNTIQYNTVFTKGLTWKQADHLAAPHENWASPTKIKNGHGEVPSTDRFMKIYINHPHTTIFLPVKWHFEIPSRLGGVR